MNELENENIPISTRLQELFKNIDEKSKKKKIKHNYKPGDIIQIGKSKTTGIIIRTTDEDIIFRTFDKSGWVEAVTSPNHITKIKIPKRTNKNIVFGKLISKINKKVFVLNQDFNTYIYDRKVTIFKGEQMIIDEQQTFLEDLLKYCKEGYHTTQLRVSYIEGEDVFSVVRCFRMKTEDFLYIPINYLTPFKWEEKLYDKLCFKHKERILSFVQNKNNTLKYGVNFHKGNGRSILLYGVLGSGKSMTAEAISHKLHKPLIRVDIEGSNAVLAIHNAFTVAERYNGIVFIDEAEMLLANRNAPYADLNSVRTLLKYMESFSGIIIFSTNYVADIDPALNSRIDLKLQYKMSDELREQLWKSMLPKKVDGKFPINEFVSNSLNGRDIQKVIMNACQRSSFEGLRKVPASYLVEETNFRLKEKLNLSGDEEDESLTNYFG